MFYDEFFTALNDRNIKYLVVGGVAVALHGVVRMTADLDLVISLDSQNIHQFLSMMKEMGYCPKLPIAPEDFADSQKRKMWKDEKNMQVFSWVKPSEPRHLIDIFVEEPIPFSQAYSRSVLLKAGKTNIYVLSMEDLITMKEKTGREQDLADIRALCFLKKQ